MQESILKQLRSFLSPSKNKQDQKCLSEIYNSLARTYEQDSISEINKTTPSFLRAAYLVDKAIENYQNIPKEQRSCFENVDEKISTLRKHLHEYNQKAMTDMKTIKIIPPPAVYEIEELEMFFSHHENNVSLRQFVSLFSFSRKKLCASVDETFGNNIYQLFSCTHFSSDGRVIAKTPGIFNGSDADNSESYNAQLMREYILKIEIETTQRLIPAYKVLSKNHVFSFEDIKTLVQKATIVPKDCVCLFSQGILMGFQGNFAGAIHLLAPQLENVVRKRLKNIDVITSTTKDGIENENGLSTLSKEPKFTKIFSEDVAFEIEAIFCNHLGPNLRNEVAHGLVNDVKGESIFVFYAWYFCLRLIFMDQIKCI